MSAFQLSDKVDENKVFLVGKRQIEKRLDPFFYIPELLELEDRVTKSKPHKLLHYAKSVSSGATPKTSESEKYYTDAENGIPFLRVQNLTATGKLNYINLKFINEESHNGMLARSKVKGGDLLIKITGVGRMAVASVTPEDFEGNVNQHMVVMKTDSPDTSHVLAAYLNSDIGEKLASRRVTGGTRPALDYSALLSIPIIYDQRILDISKAAVEKKEAKDQQAKSLLDSIDDYLLGELRIELPEKEVGLEKRIFKVNFANVTGGRYDTYFFQEHFRKLDLQIAKSNYQAVLFGQVLINIVNGFDFRAYGSEGTPYVRVGNIRPGQFNLAGINHVDFSMEDLKKDIELKKGDLLFTRKGTYGVALALVKDEPFVISSEIFNIKLKQKLIDAHYLEAYLNCPLGTWQSDRNKIGAIMGSLTQEAVRKMKIVLPPITKQKEIADHIRQIRQQAKILRQEADNELKRASKEVEKIILNQNIKK